MTTELAETVPAEILKTDVLGRVRVRKERREQILDEFEKSGMAGKPCPIPAVLGEKFFPEFSGF